MKSPFCVAGKASELEKVDGRRMWAGDDADQSSGAETAALGAHRQRQMRLNLPDAESLLNRSLSGTGVYAATVVGKLLEQLRRRLNDGHLKAGHPG
jgi:hypothetical protein